MSSFSENLGSLLVGTIAMIYFTAVVNDLGFLYFVQNPLDHVCWKLAVSGVLMASTAHTGIVCRTLYGFLITNFGITEETGSEWELIAQIAFYIAISLLVQLYYAAKISTLYGGKTRAALVSAVVLLALATTGFGGASCYAMSTFTAVPGEPFKSEQSWEMMAGLICATSMVISISMVVDMRSGRFAMRSESPADVLSRLLIETNVLTTICSIMNLVTYFVFHSNGISVAFSIVTPKLYLISMFISLQRSEDSAAGISSKGLKHQSSLSEMFKGKPLFSGRVSRSAISQPIPTVRFPHDPFSTNSPAFRRTNPSLFDEKAQERSADAHSMSEYGSFAVGNSTSVHLGTPKEPEYSESTFSKQRESPNAYAKSVGTNTTGEEIDFGNIVASYAPSAKSNQTMPSNYSAGSLRAQPVNYTYF
ncbi:hypothetical protein MNV49_004990 [Pseudohyphozyma bogoriensis]|nr:hypothetical protein MNV49_004990 [Pseudohyphozyma bogoriensis]